MGIYHISNFVQLQIKIIHIYLRMSRTIDRIFCNPVENSSHGHPPYPSEISTLQAPNPMGISIDNPCGEGEGGMDYFLESHDVCLQAYTLSLPSPHDFFTLSPNREPSQATLEGLERIMATAFWLNIITPV